MYIGIQKNKYNRSATVHVPPPLVEHRRYAVTQLVEALSYKPKDRGLNSRLDYWGFSLT